MNGLISFTFEIINLGAASGLILLGVWLLRPVTARLLTPRQRFWLWAVGWLSCGIYYGYEMFSWIQVLPVTFRDLITPRSDYDGVPDYLPDMYKGEGPYYLAFPGGGAVRVELTDAIGLILFFAWLVGAVAVGTRMWLSSRRIRRLTWGSGVTQHFKCEVNGQPVHVYLCDNISTSFAYHPLWSSWAAVFLQRDLPEQRRALVLKHELKHIECRHCWLKGYSIIALVLHWWNPIMWLTYFATCRDLELDCDNQTMQELTPAERQEYAHTLLELGVGKQLWDAPLCFGECDAAARVRAVAAWRPVGVWRRLGTWLLTIFLLLCFMGGPAWGGVELPADVALEQRLVQENWQRLTRQDTEELAQKLKTYLNGAYRMSVYDDIAEIWIAEDGGQEGFCRISTGTWRKVNFHPTRNGIGFTGGFSVEVPELTNFTRVY